MYISSTNNDRIKELVKLKEKKYRDITNLFFVEGLDIIKEAYNASLLKTIYVLEGYEPLYKDIETIYVSTDVMKKISDISSITGYYGVCKKKEEKAIGNRIIILDDLQDPGNLGTIIRSACAFNFDTVVLSKKTVDLYNPKVLRSTKGMIFNINIITRDLSIFIPTLNNYLICGTDVNKGTNIKEIDIPSKIAIVIGNEGRGISKEIAQLCNKFIYIKMNKNCESLNASIASSILMYEVDNK